MRTLNPHEAAFLVVCENKNPRGIRNELVDFPTIDGTFIEEVLKEKLAEPDLDLKYLMYLAWALVALLPSSYESVQRVLSSRSPVGIYEVHFSIFNALDRDEFNRLEQDGIEALLAEYLMNARSTAAYAAWEAGHVMGHDWFSPRTERALIHLIANARFPAGRLGAINGYSWLVQYMQATTRAGLAPLKSAARNDPSKSVRDQAKFEISSIKERRANRDSTI